MTLLYHTSIAMNDIQVSTLTIVQKGYTTVRFLLIHVL